MSPLYKHFKEFKLEENMRTDPNETEFSEYILKLGEGKDETFDDISEDTMMIPQSYVS